jgi:FkbM family methyltransferase
MNQFSHTPAEMMTRFLNPESSPVIIDVGANVGDTCAGFLTEFPHATIFAIEPVSDVFQTLVDRYRSMPGVRPFRLAVGEKPGEVTFNVTRNRWCSSLLAPSERGKAYYGDWYDVVRSETVPLVTLDQFADEQALDQIDILKIDVQGLELPVLRGARELLTSGRVKVVQCEAQLVPEYEGASTFSEVDLFFRERGLTIHQIHQLEVKGKEQQSSYLDAIWLRNDVLEELRKNPRRITPRCVSKMRSAFDRCLAGGHTKVAIYGAGQHTLKCAEAFVSSPVDIIAAIDDNPSRQGGTVAGLPIVSAGRAIALGATAVVLSSDAHEDALWEKTAPLRSQGVRIERLYVPAESSSHTALASARC